jgi:hypothetical protein
MKHHLIHTDISLPRITRGLVHPLAAILLLALLFISSASAITWGELDNGAHPNVGAIVIIHDPYPETTEPRIMCSGSLIHERIFLTAGHCTSPIARVVAAGTYTLNDFRVSFADNALDPATWLELATVATHPGYRSTPDSAGGGPMIDVGLVILKDPVTGIEPVAIAAEGLLDRLKKDSKLRDNGDAASFTSAGYGTTLAWPPSEIISPDGLRRHADSSYRALFKHWLAMSQNQALDNGGTGYGDSGGPTFWINPATGEKILVAITSRGDIPTVSTGVCFRIDIPESLDFIQEIRDAVEAGEL